MFSQQERKTNGHLLPFKTLMNRSSLKKLGYKVIYTGLYRAHRIYCTIRNPEVFGSYILCMHEHKVLLIKNSYKRYWTFPCGGIAAHETPIQAAIREAKEEVGLNLLSDQLLLRAKFLYEGEGQRDNIHLFEYRFETKPQVQIDHREVEDFCWVSKEELSQFIIFDPILPYIHEAFEV